MSFKKNERLELEITGVTAEGFGVGRCQGQAVFVPLAAPGDRAEVKILKPLKNFAYGKLERLLSPSPHRVEPDCPVFEKCGGCCFRHIGYQAELELKERRVLDALTRIGGLSAPQLEPILPAKSRCGYRNKALLPLGTGSEGQLQMGFYAPNSHRIVDCSACRLQPPEFTAAMDAFRDWAQRYGDPIYDEASHSGKMRRLYLRKAESTGEILVCVVVNGNGLRHEKELLEAMKAALPGLASLQINSLRERTNVALGKRCRVIYGKESIEDRLCGLTFQISPLSFYQVNRSQAQVLYEKAAEYAALTGEETLLDLYCGTGTIGLSLAHKAKKLLGVEIVPEAVENAWENARANGITNAEFLCADASQAAALLSQRGEKPQVVILDPPRKGCGSGLVETVAAFDPQRIVYVSCDPATLARDIKAFAPLGYQLRKACPVDMFPATAHVEVVCLLSKLKANHI